MATKKKNKLPAVISNHPATAFLNYCYHNNIKVLLPDVDNIYERLHFLHLQGKADRPHLSYLTTREIESFIHSHRKAHTPELDRAIFETAHLFSVALGWKQFQQVYTFHPTLLDELYNIDIHDDKFATISREEIEFLPCFNFYVEQEIKSHNTTYHGFFVYFDEINKTDSYGQIHVLLLRDFKGLPRNPVNGHPMQVDYYNLTLLYSYDKFRVYDKSKNEVHELDVEPIEVLRMYNPNTFKEMGDDAAMEMITHITQIITYLSATNADYGKPKKPTKKPDIKRTNISDAESERWTLGARVYSRFGRPPFVGVYSRTHEIDNPDIITIELEEEPKEPSTRRTGYHVRPHMRRAHWSYYWYGKKDGSEERVKRRKFVSAVFINAQNEEEIIPTVEYIKYRF